jgi:N-methylhydantoinase A/oxoprolinase/acetone carboxylase beta subunit
MAAVIVPARAGVLSAVGLLAAPVQRDLVRSWPTPGDHAGLDAALVALAEHAAALVGAGAETSTALDCRYEGQSHELTVAAVSSFHEAHRLRNGFARPGAAVEVIAVRATASVAAPMVPADLPTTDRRAAVGPVALAEPDCTIWVPAGWSAAPGAAGALVLRRSGS